MLKAIIVGILYLFCVSAIIMWMWAGIVVPIFNVPSLGYWQTFGLIIMLRLIPPIKIKAREE